LVINHAEPHLLRKQIKDGPSLLCDEEPEGLSQPQTWTNENLPPHTLPLRLRPGETLLEYEQVIPDIDRNEY
jgi:hypothetical protein